MVDRTLEPNESIECKAQTSSTTYTLPLDFDIGEGKSLDTHNTGTDGGTRVYECTFKLNGVTQSLLDADQLTENSEYVFGYSQSVDCHEDDAIVAFTTAGGVLKRESTTIFPHLTVGSTTTVTMSCAPPKARTSITATLDLEASAHTSIDLLDSSEDLQDTVVLQRISDKVYKATHSSNFALKMPAPPGPQYIATPDDVNGNACTACRGSLKASVSLLGVNGNADKSASNVGITSYCTTSNKGCQPIDLEDDYTQCVATRTHIHQNHNTLDLIKCTPKSVEYDFTQSETTCGSTKIVHTTLTQSNYANACRDKLQTETIFLPACDITDASDVTSLATGANGAITYKRDNEFFDERVNAPDIKITAPTLIRVTDHDLDKHRKYEVTLVKTNTAGVSNLEYSCNNGANWKATSTSADSFLCPYEDLSDEEYDALKTQTVKIRGDVLHQADKCAAAVTDDLQSTGQTVTFTSAVKQDATAITMSCSTTHGQYQDVYKWVSGASTILSTSQKCKDSATYAGTATCTSQGKDVVDGDDFYLDPRDYNCARRAAGKVGGYLQVDQQGGSKRVPILCPGPCAMKLDGVSLDYGISFDLEGKSLSSSILNSKIITPSGTDHAGIFVVKTTSTVISNVDKCNADGTLADCIVNKDKQCNDNTNLQSTSAHTVQDFINYFAAVEQQTATVSGASSAKFTISQHVGFAYDAYGYDDLDFCQSVDYEIAVTEKKGQLSSSLVVKDYDEFDFHAQYSDLGWEGCNAAGEHRVFVHVDVEASTPVTTSMFRVTTVAPLTYTHSVTGGVLQFQSPCMDVCSDPMLLTYLGSEHTFDVVVTKDFSDGLGNRGADFQIKSKILGLPVDCLGPRDTTSRISQVELRTYLKEADETCAASNDTAAVSDIVAGQDTVCFEIGDWTNPAWNLQVDNVRTIFTQYGAVVTPAGTSNPIAEQTLKSNVHPPGSFAPANGDQGGTYTVIVDFTQPTNARRLRTVYHFGVGEGHKEGSVRILPAEVQVQEQIEAAKAEPEAEAEAEGSSGATTIDNTTIYIGASLIVTGAAVWILTMTKCCSDKLHCCQGSEHAAVGARKYNKVRNFERFSSNIAF